MFQWLLNILERGKLVRSAAEIKADQDWDDYRVREIKRSTCKHCGQFHRMGRPHRKQKDVFDQIMGGDFLP